MGQILKKPVEQPDITRQIGPFFGDFEALENMHVAALKKLGCKWFRITHEGRMSMIEGWKSERPPENMPDVPELRGKLPDGWRAGR